MTISAYHGHRAMSTNKQPTNKKFPRKNSRGFICLIAGFISLIAVADISATVVHRLTPITPLLLQI